MAGSVNKVILVGHLGRDPEIRASAAMPDARVATLNIATSETWKDRHSGDRKEKTEWHKVVIFNPNLVEVAEKYLRKGSPVYIEGALQTRKWTDQSGQEKYTTEVVIGRFKGELTLLGGGGNGSTRPPPAGSPDDYGTTRDRPPGAYGAGAYDGGVDARGRSTPPPGDLDDEIPF